MENEIRILYCDCVHAEVLPTAVKQRVLARLREERVRFEAVSDLCGLAARRDPLLAEIAAASDVRIAACYPRAVKCLFEMAGVALKEEHVRVLNMRADDAETVLSGLLTGDAPKKCACCGDDVTFADVNAGQGDWMPWFPVIDLGRCTNCKQCLSFCLFGVFGVGEDGHVEVQKPANCKTGCPACSRVCPNVAIVFPKYDKSPINGDEVHEGDLGQDPVKVDVNKLIDGGLQASLRGRSDRAAGRFSTKRRLDDEGVARLRQMQVELDIPESVIDQLTSEGAKSCSCGCNSQEPAFEPAENACANAAAGACACECTTGEAGKAADPAACGCSPFDSGEDAPEKKRPMDAGSGPCSCNRGDGADDASEAADSQEEWDL